MLERASERRVVVVGAGLAGLSAALRIAQQGGWSTVLERQESPDHVCASRANGGVFHVGFRSVTTPPDEIYRVVRNTNEGFGDPALARALADHAHRAVDWLRALGTEFTRLVPDDGWKDMVLAPVGFHDKTHMAWKGLGADRLIGALEARLVALGGRVLRGVRATGLLVDRGRVVGVAANAAQGRVEHRADAVILADGGFEGSREMVAEYITPHPEHLLLRGCESGLGDGMRMARAVGGRLIGMEAFYGHILSADSLHREGLSPFPFLEFLASAGMLVDARGERFVDETAGGHFTSNALARRGNGLGCVVFDHAMWEGIGRHFFCPPNPNLVEAGGTLHRAASLEELALALGFPRDALAAHARALNAEIDACAVAAQDAASRNAMTAYAKGKHPHEKFATPPYYAAPACAALTSTMGGIAIDAHGRVLDCHERPIPGLYAAGSVTGGIEGGPAVGYLGGLAKALVFGLLAAEDVTGRSSAAMG